MGAPTRATQLIGESPAICALLARIPVVAGVQRTTLISGPTGVGKEVVAARLHEAAPHSKGAPFVPVHCGALPEHLAEAELFGHTRGAFTGASHNRDGLVRAATGGTLFLDEVDSLSLPLQSKLLRFLETGEFRAVGSDATERAAVWVLAATNCDLPMRVQAGTFREDLLYRLDVMRLEVPALRNREADVDLLARHFLEAAGGKAFTPRALRALRRHAWPGNVRELKHRVERATLLSVSGEVDAEDLDLPVAEILSVPPTVEQRLRDELWRMIDRDGMSFGEVLAVCERELIRAALSAERENRTRAAHRLGIHVRTIFKKLGAR